MLGLWELRWRILYQVTVRTRSNIVEVCEKICNSFLLLFRLFHFGSPKWDWVFYKDSMLHFILFSNNKNQQNGFGVPASSVLPFV